MQEIIIILSIIFTLIMLKIIFNFSIKTAKQIADNKELNELTNRLPDNETICKDILNSINNSDVNIKQSNDEKSETSLYIVATNTIIIAKIRESYARVQTIAHECIHSIQDKKLLLFNFIFTNIYLVYNAKVVIIEGGVYHAKF